MAFNVSNFIVQINNQTIATVPNTQIFIEGKGEDTVSAAALGTTKIPINGINIEDALGMIKFSVYSTPENIAFMRSVKDTPGVNVVRLTDPQSDLSRVLTSATLITNYEVAAGHDASFEVEFKGNELS